MARACFSSPPMKWRQVSEIWIGASGSKNAFLPSFASEQLVCIPLPQIPYMGFAMKEACSPRISAIVFAANLNVMTLSAVWRASLYLKSISCWLSATSWCEASISNPISVRARIISRLTSSARSVGARSK